MNYGLSGYRFTSVWGFDLCGCRHVFLITFLLVLTGCYAAPSNSYGTPAPFSCADFTESLWQEFSFGVDSPEDVVSAVVSFWGNDKDDVLIDKLTNSQFRVRWTGDNAKLGYSAFFRSKRQLTKVTARWGNPQPALVQIIDCLGPPEYYQAYYEQGPEARSLRLGLWYIEKGFVVEGYSFHRLAPPPAALQPEYRMSYFTVVPPGAPEQMVFNVYTVGDDSHVREFALCRLRPWPSSIDAIDIEKLSEPCNWQFGPDGEAGRGLGNGSKGEPDHRSDS